MCESLIGNDRIASKTRSTREGAKSRRAKEVRESRLSCTNELGPERPSPAEGARLGQRDDP